MPSGLIDDEKSVRARIDGGADFLKMRVHGVGVAPWQDEAGAFACRRADRAEDIGPCGALIVRRARPCSLPCPAARDLVLLADPDFVLKPDFQRHAGALRRADLRHFGGEVFLKASTASSFCA